MHTPLRAASLLALLGLAGCPYTYTANDAGHGAWVEQVVPVVLGRKPINALETKVLVDIAEQDGRMAVLDVLMSLPEFDHYWSMVLADALKVQRSGVLLQSTGCWNNYTMYGSVGVANETLADGLSTQLSGTATPPGVTTFTNADTLRSAIAADDLFAPYRAQLFSLGRAGYEWSGPARDVFLAGYTNRTPLCLQCHTSTWSTSDMSSIPVDIDGRLFPGGYWSADNTHFAFAEDLTTTASAFGVMTSTCGSWFTSSQVDPGLGTGTELAGIHPTLWDCAASGNSGADCESLDILDIDAALITGKTALEETVIATGLLSTQSVSTSFTHPGIPGEESLALALALTVTEAIVKEVEGHGLTLPHGHPRVDEQRSYLQGYTYHLIASNWQLRTLLKTLVHSGTFNMRPPSQSPSAYPFPMFFDGWAADPADDDASDNVNGQGDLVHRYSVPALFRSVHHALGWTAPKVLPLAGGYANRDLQRTLGRYESYEETGFDTVTYQSLLAWEGAVGTCVSPAGPDWIDLVVTRVNADALDGSYDLSLLDVLVAVKDRLVQEPSVDDGYADPEEPEDPTELGELDDGGVDWADPEAVGAWAEREASRSEERARQRARARTLTAVLEREMAALEADPPEDGSERPDDAWLDAFDDYTVALDDPTWTRTWNNNRGRVTEGEAVTLLDDHGVSTRMWTRSIGGTEAALLSDYFGVSLGYPAGLVEGLEDLLRGYCGTLLTSPQFMLGGMRRDQPEADPIPELLVCGPAEVAAYCDETLLCELYNGYLTAHPHAPLVCPP